MNSDALVAALGGEAIVAVHSYRLEVIAEARRRGLVLVPETPADVVQLFASECDFAGHRVIRLIILDGPGGGGARLRWTSYSGWRLARPGLDPDCSSYVRAGASGLDLVPAAPAVVDWVAEELHGAQGDPTDGPDFGVSWKGKFVPAATCGALTRRNYGCRRQDHEQGARGRRKR